MIPPVGLLDIVEEAELLARVDRKYVVALDEVPGLVASSAPGTRVLEISGRRSFGYSSTYLDTPDLESYLTSGRSHRRRWKVRSRSYLDTGGTWLEVKTAGPRGRTIKQRVACTTAAEQGLSPAATALVVDAVGPAATARLRPVLVTTYRRTTLLLPHTSARITLDVDPAWASLSTGHELHRPRLAIVETKTGSTPSTFDRLLWARGHRPVRISKYGVGMAALHPDLPHLKWHRALERHLRAATSTYHHPADRPTHQLRSTP